MRLKRVVVTGLGAVSPFGFGVDLLFASLLGRNSAIQRVPALEAVRGLRCRIGGLAPDPDLADVSRSHRRSMSRMSRFAVLACQEALQQGGVDAALCGTGRLGVAMGSSVGSPETFQDFFSGYLRDFSIEAVKSQLFFKVMSHSCAANVAQALGITGRVLAPAAACASSGQALGLGFEAIALGRQDLMLCGGADELHPMTTGTFDIINAASTGYNDRPQASPRPFDLGRDGTVCSEGCGVLLLESLDSALERGAEPLAEILGFSLLTDVSNIASPGTESIEACMRQALEQAGIPPQRVDCVNAHATATLQGDQAEGQAIERIFGDRPLVFSNKGHLGHCLAASGGLECAALVRTLRTGRVPATLHLEDVDLRCGKIHYVTEETNTHVSVAVKNSFALGGVNTSLVVAAMDQDRR